MRALTSLPVTVIWGIHNDQPTLDLVGGGFISVGWDEVGDLRKIGSDREALKLVLATCYPEAKAGAIPVWSGVLDRFGFEMQAGDLVISPNKADSTLSFGRLVGDYYWDPDAEVHHHRRKVTWLHTGVPRVTFSQTARNEIGSAVTLFKVKRHADEFLAFIESGQEPPPPVESAPSTDDAALASAEEEPSADRIESYSRDFIIETLHRRVDPYRFEHFAAALLRAMGYRAQVTQASGDGGVDVIAYRDPLGLEPPIIKVQCKRTLNTIGGPEVQKLAGALAHGGSEVGLFVTLGAYSNDALHIERTRQDLRLINGTELVSLIFSHYEQLDAEWRRLLPLRRVYVVDREPEAT
jgi:restriction system protein